MTPPESMPERFVRFRNSAANSQIYKISFLSAVIYLTLSLPTRASSLAYAECGRIFQMGLFRTLCQKAYTGSTEVIDMNDGCVLFKQERESNGRAASIRLNILNVS